MIGGTGARPVGPTVRNFKLANGWRLSTFFSVWLIRSVPFPLAMNKKVQQILLSTPWSYPNTRGTAIGRSCDLDSFCNPRRYLRCLVETTQ